MIKIFAVDQIKEADAYTIANEPVASIDLMERAANACYQWLKTKIGDREPRFFIYCGPGNNGGDGLAIARMLRASQYQINICISSDQNLYSADSRENLNRLNKAGITVVDYVSALKWAPGPDDVIIDALFGSGLSRSLDGIFAEIINSINKSAAVVVAIDIPSGLFADKACSNHSLVVNADFTLSFQFPKLSFFLSENEIHTGEWIILPIGLHPQVIQEQHTNNYLVTKKDAQELRKPRSRFSHKGTFGHALLISGSHGKMGAAVLASQACLRSGVGLLTTHVPVCGYEIMQISVPEAMISVDPCQNDCSRIPDLSNYSAIGIGPGLGRSKEANNTLRLLLQETKVPLILDADALNILSEQKTWQAFIPAGSILTPHPKEFERLAGKWSDGFEMLELLREYALKHKVFIVLKGAYTITCTPGGNCFFNSSGNPGMATGGSGDVLTGILTGLLAQHYSPLDACILGVYLHGLAGDLAAAETGYEAMVAGDIAGYLGKAYKSLE
jgi:NAD(P)H-hydrate epimerase